MEIEQIKIGRIVADENQPRKYFAANKMKSLMDSIKREGIISPLTVEKVGENFLLLDGERRFRAAQELGLKDVPAVVEAPKNSTDRLVRQFTVQEQHEGWTPIEKANALVRLSDEIGISLTEVCKLLNVTESERNRYNAFALLADKDLWVRNEMPVDLALGVKTLKNLIKRVSMDLLNEEFTKQDEKKLEKRVVEGVKAGTIVARRDLITLGYAFEKNPKLIAKFMEKADISPASLYLEAGAAGARALRNAVFSSAYIGKYIKDFLATPDVKLTETQIEHLKYAQKAIKQLLDFVGA